MNCLDLIMFHAPEPGPFQVKDQIVGILIVMAFFRKAKSYARKHMTIGLYLKPQMAIAVFGMHQPFTGKQKGRIGIAFTKRLQSLQSLCKIFSEIFFFSEMVVDFNPPALAKDVLAEAADLPVEQLRKLFQIAVLDRQANGHGMASILADTFPALLQELKEMDAGNGSTRSLEAAGVIPDLFIGKDDHRPPEPFSDP